MTLHHTSGYLKYILANPATKQAEAKAESEASDAIKQAFAEWEKKKVEGAIAVLKQSGVVSHE